jgi:hypothetical protein
MDHILSESWSGPGRVALVGAAAYVATVLVLRVNGKPSLAKLDAFDLVVTVALGSTMAISLLSETAALAEGVAALALLLLVQYVIVSWGIPSPLVPGGFGAGLGRRVSTLVAWNELFLGSGRAQQRPRTAVRRHRHRAGQRRHGRRPGVQPRPLR